MRTIWLLVLVLFLSLSLDSQVKILFDATKAETAGNADWVIDADNWNLGYNPYPYIGGNEANAQRYPTPSEQNITPSTSEDYWTGGISAWGVELAKAGYIVETLPYDGSITYGDPSNPQDLANYKVFIVCEPNILFTASEKNAIINFVRNGGGLFMISDHDNSDRNGDGYDSPYIWNDLMQNNSVEENPFGITFDYADFTEQTDNIPYSPDNPILNGPYGSVSLVEFYGGTSLTLSPSDNPSVRGLVYRRGYSNTGNTGVMCAYATYGNGKVVAMGDSSPADDGTGDTGDHLYDGWYEDANGNHRKLILNATVWLAQSSSDVSMKNKPQIIINQLNGYTQILVPSLNNNSTAWLSIYDITGREILSKKILTSEFVPIEIYKPGVYFYQVAFNNRIYKGKLLIHN